MTSFLNEYYARNALPASMGGRHPFIGIVLIFAALYAALQFTPSSYAIVLHAIGISDDGLVFGLAKPVRSDEWAIWTPYVQIAVNNGFARVDTLSPYGEDLRNFNALPLADWGLVFKPQLWAFFLLSPAAAFSLMFAILLAACLTGWYRLALELGFDKVVASIFSLSIFALPYVQLWWTSTGPLIAFLPWLLLAHLLPMPFYLRIAAVAWCTATFLLSHFYVPFVATLIFGAGLTVIAMRPDTLRIARLIPSLAGAAIGVAFVLIYLWEPIRIMADTVYPGQRTNVPGGLLPNSFLLAYLFPHFLSSKWDALYWNDLEIGTGGSYTLLFCLVFLNFRRLRDVMVARIAEDRATRWMLLILSAGILLIVMWWLLPIPSRLATPLFWNATAPQRLAFAAGLLAHVVAFILVLRVGAVASLSRVVLAIGLILAVTFVSKFKMFPPDTRALKYDLAILPLLLLAYFARNATFDWGPRLLLCGAVSNALVFVPFNPLQKAGPIFAKHDTPPLRALAAKQAVHPKQWLVTRDLDGALHGAVLVGLGFRSIQHTLIAPQLAFFRERFPDLPRDQFNQIFNRYAFIILDPAVTAPTVPQNDVILVPPAAFD
jgi:hypothetical protein